jgi:hypothetical protein
MELLRRELRSPYKLLDRIGLILQRDLNEDIAECQGSIPPTIDGSEVITTREPFGPVLSIPAFNFPMTLAMRSIGAYPYPRPSGSFARLSA